MGRPAGATGTDRHIHRSDGPVRPALTTQTVSLDASILFTSRRAAILFTGSAWHGADRRLSPVRLRGGQSLRRLLSWPADLVTPFQQPPFLAPVCLTCAVEVCF